MSSKEMADKRSLRSPAFMRAAVSTRSASPFVRLENSKRKSQSRRGSHALPPEPEATGSEAIDLALPPELEDTGSEAETHSCRPSFVSPRATEYCCAICIELLLRPVVLSCGHHLCRGCWLRVLQGSQARAVASRTGNAACPLGRCEVKASVPEVDLDLESEMHSRLGFKQLVAHAAAAELAPLAEESAAAAAVNAWAAAGFKLDTPEEVEAAQALAVAAEVSLDIFHLEGIAASNRAAAFSIEGPRVASNMQLVVNSIEWGLMVAVLLLLSSLSLLVAGLLIWHDEALGAQVTTSHRPLPPTNPTPTPHPPPPNP